MMWGRGVSSEERLVGMLAATSPIIDITEYFLDLINSIILIIDISVIASGWNLRQRMLRCVRLVAWCSCPQGFGWLVRLHKALLGRPKSHTDFLALVHSVFPICNYQTTIRNITSIRYTSNVG